MRIVRLLAFVGLALAGDPPRFDGYFVGPPANINQVPLPQPAAPVQQHAPVTSPAGQVDATDGQYNKARPYNSQPGHYTKVYFKDITEPGIKIYCFSKQLAATQVLLTTVKPKESEKAHLLIDKSLFDNLWCLETYRLLQEIDKYIVFETTRFLKDLFNECLNDADQVLFEQYDGGEMSLKDLFDKYKDNAQMYSLIGKLLFCKRKETDYLLTGNSYFFITKDSVTSLNGIFDKYKDDAHMHSFVCKMLFDKYKCEQTINFQSFSSLKDDSVMEFMLQKNQKVLGETTVEQLKNEDEIHLP